MSERPASHHPWLRSIARRRVTLGFIVLGVVLWFADPSLRSWQIGAVVALAGEALRVWAAGHLEKGREVTSSGPYAWTRHPLYLGSTIMGIGLAIASASAVVAAIIVLYLLITLTAAMRTEEAHLTEKFGEAYPAYRDGRAPGLTRRFSLARAIRNREHRAFLGAFAVLAVLLWKAVQ